jgi:anthranilate phosphoribosyltransferase
MSTSVMRDALERVVAGDDLSVEDARAVMDVMMDGGATAAQVGALLGAMRSKGESVGELCGMLESMREHAVTVSVAEEAIDTCGTGGDHLGTFNISTAAALVAAGAGCVVAKHGNRAASSRCGSADVLEALGVTVNLPPDGVLRCIDAAGIGFLYAPAYHPAMRHVAAIRRELGIRTAFNLLGPMANPARVRRQVLGVPDAAVGARLAAVLQRGGHERALVVTGHGGIDELSVDGPSICHEVSHGTVTAYDVDASAFGMARGAADELRGAEPAVNAARIRAVLQGDRGTARDTVVLNAAAAVMVAGAAADLGEGIERAQQSIDSGAALQALETLVTTSQQAA